MNITHTEAQRPQGKIIFENDACMVINKLPGESSELPETGGNKNNGAPPRILAVHRLDMPVSGCLVLAKTPEAAAFLSAAFASHDTGRVEKRYWAIIEKPANDKLAASGELLHWISFDSKKNKSFAHNEAGQGRKKAVMRYRIAGSGNNYLFLEIELITGRHHQIRAQLAALGLHIKGDLKYGARRSEKNGGIRLHAYSLNFPNPLNPAEKIEAKALPPLEDALWTAFAQAAGATFLARSCRNSPGEDSPEAEYSWRQQN